MIVANSFTWHDYPSVLIDNNGYFLTVYMVYVNVFNDPINNEPASDSFVSIINCDLLPLIVAALDSLLAVQYGTGSYDVVSITVDAATMTVAVYDE
ncbi:MAG: hypothetical protein HXY40_05670 [Chloroflexi bacterium]|nr:hypothetical protein [Chloroflexota bacterium]